MVRDQPWLHPDVELRDSAIEGRGLFARLALGKGVTVVRLGGRVVGTDELQALIVASDADPDAPYVDTVTVAADLHLVLPPGTAVHFGNHSCDPNLWHDDALTIVTRAAVAAGDELTVDYATQTGVPEWRMDCRCGSPLCRGVVTGEDWRLPELQSAYAGHWTPALAERIAGQG
jgi:uncharacterized protein